MQNILSDFLIAISSIPRQAVIGFLAILLLVLFLLLIFCLCRAAKMGSDDEAEWDEQTHRLQQRK